MHATNGELVRRLGAEHLTCAQQAAAAREVRRRWALGVAAQVAPLVTLAQAEELERLAAAGDRAGIRAWASQHVPDLTKIVAAQLDHVAPGEPAVDRLRSHTAPRSARRHRTPSIRVPTQA